MRAFVDSSNGSCDDPGVVTLSAKPPRLGRDAWLNPRHFLRANEGVKPWHGASHDAHCLFRISACASSRRRYADHVAGCPDEGVTHSISAYTQQNYWSQGSTICFEPPSKTCNPA